MNKQTEPQEMILPSNAEMLAELQIEYQSDYEEVSGSETIGRKEDLFVILRARGASYRTIGERLGVSKSTIGNWAKRLETEIRHRQSFEYDALVLQYGISRGQRLTSLGKIMARIDAELETRDLSDVPTDKLIALKSKLIDQAKDFCEFSAPMAKDERAQAKALAFL